MTLQKIKEKKAHIGIIGLGYVGLPLAIEFCKTGFQVTGLDTDQEKIDLLSPREFDVFCLLAKGMTAHEASEQLHGRRFLFSAAMKGFYDSAVTEAPQEMADSL